MNGNLENKEEIFEGAVVEQEERRLCVEANTWENKEMVKRKLEWGENWSSWYSVPLCSPYTGEHLWQPEAYSMFLICAYHHESSLSFNVHCSEITGLIQNNYYP